jgi:GNAT superfamily N-acetyltransferase
MEAGMAIAIRQATETDAADAVETLRRSIAELCVADHQNDPAKIDGWLGNKTIEAWRDWGARDDAILLVAERNRSIVGVGMATLSGEILLNYVHPAARFSGVSKALLAGLEDVLRRHGATHCSLKSTITARSFYTHCGYASEAGHAFMLSKLL